MDERPPDQFERISVVTAGLLAALVPHDLLRAPLSRAKHAVRVREQAAAVTATPVFQLAVLARRRTLFSGGDRAPGLPASLREADDDVRRHIDELAELADMDAETAFKVVYLIGTSRPAALGEPDGGAIPSGGPQNWRERGARRKRGALGDSIVAMQRRWGKRAGVINTYYRDHDVDQANVIHRIDRIERDIPQHLLPDPRIHSHRKALESLIWRLELPYSS